MARTLHADGISGKSFIYNNDSDPSQYMVPTPAQLGDLHFHSDLAYLGNSQVVQATITHPHRERNSTRPKWSSTIYLPKQGTQTYDLGYNPLGANAPFVVFDGNSQVPSGLVTHQAGESVRAVSVFLEGNRVKLYENWATFQNNLGAVNRTYKVYIFQTLYEGSGNESIRIEPSQFRAGFGKLDTNYRYVRSVSPPDLYLASGRTADVQGGGMRVVLPNGHTQVSHGTYTGNFSGAGGRGVKI